MSIELIDKELGIFSMPSNENRDEKLFCIVCQASLDIHVNEHKCELRPYNQEIIIKHDE